jgi:hypothetical protein
VISLVWYFGLIPGGKAIVMIKVILIEPVMIIMIVMIIVLIMTVRG